MRRKRTRLKTDSSVVGNMTPMIDVVFLLMIFFMLVAQIQRSRALELDLARIDDAASTELDKQRARIVISVVPTNQGGGILIDGNPAPLNAITNAVSLQPGAQVEVAAARDEPYDRVAPVLDAARLGGAQRVSLVVIGDTGSPQGDPQ